MYHTNHNRFQDLSNNYSEMRRILTTTDLDNPVNRRAFKDAVDQYSRKYANYYNSMRSIDRLRTL